MQIPIPDAPIDLVEGGVLTVEEIPEAARAARAISVVARAAGLGRVSP